MAIGGLAQFSITIDCRKYIYLLKETKAHDRNMYYRVIISLSG